MSVHETHEIYKSDDFTDEERDRKNTLAVAVINQGLAVCKQCGECGTKLVAMCTASNDLYSLDIRDRQFEDKLREEGAQK